MASLPAVVTVGPDSSLDDVEQALFARVQAKDVGALAELLQRWRPWLVRRVRRDLGGRQPGGRRPSDLVQESCVLALRFLPDFHGGSRQELRGWLTTILHTALQQALRHSRARMRADGATETLAVDPPLQAPRPSQLVSSRESYRAVVVALSRLPPRQREVLYWRLLEERSLAEIAERIGDTEQAAASRIKRGLARLRHALLPERGKVARPQAARVDAALADYLRLCDRGQPPEPQAFLLAHPDCASGLAPLLDWLRLLTQQIAGSGT